MSIMKGFKQNIKQKLKETAVNQRREIEGVLVFEEGDDYIFIFGNVERGIERFHKTLESVEQKYLGLATNAKLDAHNPFDLLLGQALKAFVDHMNRNRTKSAFSAPVMLNNNYYIKIAKTISPEQFRKTALHAFSKGDNLSVTWQEFNNLIFK